MQKIVVNNVNLCAKWNFKYFIIRSDIVNKLYIFRIDF